MKLTPIRALVAVCVAVLMLPSAAFAARKSKLTIKAHPAHIVTGATLDLHGKRGGKRHARRPVTLLEKLVGGAGFTKVAKTRTTAGGGYEFRVANLAKNAVFQVKSPGVKSSKRLQVPVSPLVTFTAGPADGDNVLNTAPATFTVNVSPATPGATVTLTNRDRRKSEVEDPIASGSVDANGNATIILPKGFGGEPRAVNVRAHVLGNKENAEGATPESRSFQVQEVQDPGFLLAAAPNPTIVGSAPATSLATVAAKVTGVPPGTPVTFLRHTSGDPGFSPFATVPTNATGDAVTPGQGFTENQVLLAQAPGRQSQRYALGVKDNLTAAPSASSVTAGQNVTIAGQSLPAHSGQRVRIEQQNGTTPSGAPRYDVISEPDIGEDGHFTDQVELVIPGTYTFRAVTLGGAENQGAVSAPFTVTVTAAPPETFG